MMIKIFIQVILLSISIVATISSQNANCKILVDVNSIPSDEGQMIISLYNSEETFPKFPIKKKFAKIINGQSTIVFDSIKMGYYAITAIHDKNKNGKLDFNFFHIPKEDACASNNAKGFMGPPKYSKARFEVRNTLVIQNLQLTKIHTDLNK